MLQTQLNQYKFDCNHLNQQLIIIKKKYYQQKKKEQLWKEQSRNTQNINIVQKENINQIRPTSSKVTKHSENLT